MSTTFNTGCECAPPEHTAENGTKTDRGALGCLGVVLGALVAVGAVWPFLMVGPNHDQILFDAGKWRSAKYHSETRWKRGTTFSGTICAWA